MFCEKCGKEHNGFYGSGRFCSASCARSYSSSLKREETNKKVSITLRARFNTQDKFCKNCGKKLGYGKNKTMLCAICYSHQSPSEESKQKQSQTMKSKNAVRWHIHRDKCSSAENFFKDVLNNNHIDFCFEYAVKNDHHYNYFLDFYIEKGDIKVDLEIDGAEHKDPLRKAHDEIRDKFLMSKGFIIYRIEWNAINSISGKELMKNKINNFLSFYNNL